MFAAAANKVDAAASFGLTPRAHVLVIVIGLIGAGFLFRLLRRRQLRGKYTLLWIAASIVVLVISLFPGLVDRASEALKIYNPPNTLFLLAIAFLGLLCVYFSYELSKLEERTRILAEELAILRGDMHAAQDPMQPEAQPETNGTVLLQSGESASQAERTS